MSQIFENIKKYEELFSGWYKNLLGISVGALTILVALVPEAYIPAPDRYFLAVAWVSLAICVICSLIASFREVNLANLTMVAQLDMASSGAKGHPRTFTARDPKLVKRIARRMKVIEISQFIAVAAFGITGDRPRFSLQMKIQDAHINLAGFLEGGPGSPLHWQSIRLDSDLSEEEWRCIEYFKLRAREFLLNVEDLKLPKLWSFSIDIGEKRAAANSNTFPGRHRVKSLYLDFRHFIANNEPSNFWRIINILTKNLDQTQPIQVFLSSLRQNFIREMNFGVNVKE